ncbi:MAG: dynamin family protein [Planctomycetaceae bacterium]|jgi:energy-coupling factor transporter ATP-binding protein EcfA2|nr:dynamin family protein [Planctomycetaceae bacterium]
MSRSNTINTIIASRQPIAEKTGRMIAHLRKVTDALYGCSDLLTKSLQKSFADEQKSVIQERQAEITHFVNNLIPDHIKSLDQLQRRFNRSTLNIGVVGNAGQGKSTLLQKLTGLADEEIPTGAKGDCTGAAAILENADVTEAYADIEFYSESEFLEQVVAPYYRNFGLPQPSTLSAFAESLPDDVKTQERSDEIEFIERLQNELHEYRPFFSELQKRIKKSEIRKFTAKSDENGQYLSFWAAVKSARVYCRFPSLTGEKISLGDTPGLGDRAVLEAEERLMKDFGRNIDAIIMLRKVNIRGIRKEDVRLFSLVKSAIPELPAEKWTYFIVNVFASDKQIPATVEALKFLPEDFRNSSLKNIAEYIELDCSDTAAVHKEFDRILNGIAGNQSTLDQILYTKRFEEVQRLLHSVTDLTAKLSALFPKNNSIDKDAMQAQSMFQDDISGNLAVKLNDLVTTKKEAQYHANEVFLNAVKKIETDLKTIPGLPEPIDMKKTAAKNRMTDAFSLYCQLIRRLTVKYFNELDITLHQIFDDLRDEVKQCFLAEDGGKLGKVVFQQENGKEKSWWASLADEIATLGETPKAQENAKQIADVIRQFETVTLSFRSFLLPRVLPCFNVLNTDREEHSTFGWKQGLDIEQLIENLRRAAEKGVANAIKLLENCAAEPSVALFAIVEDLHDAVFRTGSSLAAQHIWSSFYAAHRSEIWQEVFQQKEADTKFCNEWQDKVEHLKNTARNIEV